MRAAMRQVCRWCRLGAPLIVAAVLQTGCTGAATPVGAVSGKVTLDGKPLSEGEINFMTPTGFGASASIQNGVYTLARSQFGQGIPPGDYLVAIGPVIKMGADPLAKTSDTQSSPDAIPDKYRNPETSGLTAKVVEGTTNIDFKLESP